MARLGARAKGERDIDWSEPFKTPEELGLDVEDAWPDVLGAGPTPEVLVAAEGGVVSGSSAVIELDGWTPQDMAIKTPADYGVDVAPRLTVVKTVEPAGRKAGVKVGSVDELIAKLKDEAGVI